jgi:hypothetical protein
MSELLLDELQEGCPFCAEGSCWVHVTPAYDTRLLPAATPEIEEQLRLWSLERLSRTAPDIYRAIMATEPAPPTPTTVERLLELEAELLPPNSGRLVREVMELLAASSGSSDSTSTPTPLPALPSWATSARDQET